MTRPRQARRTGDTALGLALAGVRRLDRGLRLAARQVERETGLSAAQLFVLEHLDDVTGLSLNELADHTFTDRSSVSAVVDRLVDAGLARRSADPDDKRRANIRITRRGRGVLDRAPAAPTQLLLRGLAQLAPAERRSLARTLARLNDELGFVATNMLFERVDDRRPPPPRHARGARRARRG